MALGCDGCAACCHLLSVEEIDKPACQWCTKIVRDANGRRCGIHEEKPYACRAFECLWLVTQSVNGKEMQPELRPDRSHVVFAMDAHVTGADEIDDNNRTLYAHVDPYWPTAWRRGLPKLAIDTFLARGGSVMVFIGPQYYERRAGWRVWEQGLVADRERAQIKRMFSPGDPLANLPLPTFDANELLRRRI
jgi:hypothetical protein